MGDCGAMKIAEIIARVLVGIVFVVFGSNAFLHYIKMPPMTGLAGDFMGALAGSGYVMVVGFCQVAGGLLLLIGRFIPLGLTLLGPVIVNILCYHIFLSHEGWQMAAIVTALTLFILWRHRANFAGLLKP
jgi:putative oxidoreductase